MPYNNNYLTDLKEIIELFKKGTIQGKDEALIKFETYLDNIVQIGAFSLDHWNKEWRLCVWEFGKLFIGNNHFQSFIVLIDKKKAVLTDDSLKEALYFVKSEIYFCVTNLPTEDKKKLLSYMVEKYPLNSEFRHSYAHFFRNEGDYKTAIENYKYAYQMEPECIDFQLSIFNTQFEYINDLIQHDSFELADKEIDEAFKTTTDINYTNILIEQRSRIQDQKRIEDKLNRASVKFDELIEERLTSERKRLIEVLGFFSAIVAFILSSLTIVISFPLKDALVLLVALSLILLSFVAALSLIFVQGSGKLIYQGRFWLLVITLLSLLIITITEQEEINLFILIKSLVG